MTDAPERIWAFEPTTFDEMDVWQSEPHDDAAEYIRADVAQAMLAKAREDALREAASFSWLCFHKCDVEVDVVTTADILALIPTAEGKA